MNLGAHWQILLTPWRRNRDSSRWSWAGLVVIALLAVAPTALAARFESIAVAWGFAVATTTFALALLWLIQLSSVQRQNHPNAARLVPGHVQQLRESVVAVYAAVALAVAALLGARFGHPLAWGLAVGCSMLLVAVILRQPWLWGVWWIVPMTAKYWTQTPLWQALRTLALTLYDTQPLALAGAGLLLLPWLASRFVQDGGASHAARFKRNEQRRRASQLTRMGQTNVRDQGRVAQFFAEAFLFIYRRWTRYLLATARPTARSVMARAELALGANVHWATHLGSLLLFGGVAAVTWAIARYGYGVRSLHFMSQGGIGMAMGITFAALLPVLSARSAYYSTRREQALLMLLPGMPRGAALNQRLARRQMLHFLVAWAMLAAGLRLSLDDGVAARVVFGYLMCWLPAGLLLWRDWSCLPAPTPVNAMLPLFGLMLAGAAMGSATWWLQWSPDSLFAVMGLGTLGLGAWRWHRLAGYPQAFPVGRRT